MSASLQAWTSVGHPELVTKPPLTSSSSVLHIVTEGNLHVKVSYVGWWLRVGCCSDIAWLCCCGSVQPWVKVQCAGLDPGTSRLSGTCSTTELALHPLSLYAMHHAGNSDSDYDTDDSSEDENGGPEHTVLNPTPRLLPTVRAWVSEFGHTQSLACCRLPRGLAPDGASHLCVAGCVSPT